MKRRPTNYKGITSHGNCFYPVHLSKEEKYYFKFAAKLTYQVQQNKNTETISTVISIILAFLTTFFLYFLTTRFIRINCKKNFLD